MKKILIGIAIFLLIAGTGIYLYRYEILQHSIESIIRNSLPDYVKIDSVRLDIKSGKIVLEKLKVLNPPVFSNKYLVEAQDLSFNYGIIGKTILDGIEVSDVVIDSPVLVIERIGDGRINLDEFKKGMEKTFAESKEKRATSTTNTALISAVSGGRKPIQMVRLPESLLIKAGTVHVIDAIASPASPHILDLERINSTISIKLDSAYSKILTVGSQGEGCLNAKADQILRWSLSINLTAPSLTMSNRLEASGLDILPFKPYYDKYSPFIFESGKFSGTLILDFDNGNIGSTNEVHLSKLSFRVKEGAEAGQFWEANVEDLARYFTSSSGEVVFDFKIKGPMSSPRFYPGPISKQALTSMMIDKISSAVEQAAKATGQEPSGQAPKSDLDKAKQYIDLFKGLMKKE